MPGNRTQRLYSHSNYFSFGWDHFRKRSVKILNKKRYEVISVIKVNEGNAKPWLGNLTNFDIYHGLFRHESHIEPFEVPHSVIENIFFLVAQRFGHKNDGIYVADVHLYENGVQNGGVKLDICIENNRIVGINHNFCYPRRKARVTQDE